MTSPFRDLRHAARALRHNRGLTIVALLTLSLGIGANTAIFSIVNSVLLRPLPVRDPNSLATVAMTNAKFNETGAQPGFASYAKWRRSSSLFESTAAAAEGAATLDLGASSLPAKVWRVSANFLGTLGVSPVLGRDFQPAEDQPGGPKVAILGNQFWQGAFSGDRRVLGTMAKIDGTTYTIVGVLPPGFDVNGRPADIYTPFGLSLESKDWLAVDVYARLRSGATPEQATAELESLDKPDPGAPFRWKPRVWRLRDFEVRDVRLSLLVLLAAVGLVLLIACANTASLLLARAQARVREMALREALGAGRGQLLRQLLTESTLLSLLGGACGVAVAALAIRALPLIQHERLPGLIEQTSIDLPVLGFTLAVSVLTGLVFGIAPALASVSPNPHETLKTGGRTGSGPRHRGFRALIVTETALALLLAIGATLLIQTFFYLRDVAPGFRVDGLVIASVNPERAKFSTREQWIAYYSEIAESARRIPGVKSVSIASNLPLTGELAGMSVQIEGHHFARPQDLPVLWTRCVDPAYFGTMQIPLRRGRFLDERDTTGSPKVVMVNEAFVRRFWPNQDPIGKHLGRAPNVLEVVGVARDVRSQDSTKDVASEVYFPYAQSPTARVTLAVRVDSNIYPRPLSVEPALRAALSSVDRGQAFSRIAEIQKLISDRIAPKRLSAQLIAIFAGLAVLLAAIGIYGVLSFTVAQRTHEIGVRMALGAERSGLLGMVIGDAARLSVTGVVFGVGAALALTRFVKSILFGVSATDVSVYAALAVGTVVFSAFAAALPAWRATRVDPIRALREE